MSSHTSFSSAAAQFVPSIVCMKCGNNAHVVRREGEGEFEIQTFKCAECGGEQQRMKGPARSDAEVQLEAEQRSGVRPR